MRMCMATVATSPFPKPTLPFGGKYITEDGGKAKNKATMLAPEAADECREEAGMAAKPPTTDKNRRGFVKMEEKLREHSKICPVIVSTTAQKSRRSGVGRGRGQRKT